MTTTYATPDDLRTFMGMDPGAPFPDGLTDATVVRYLRTASALVAGAIQGKVYAVDANGLPTDPAYRTAVGQAAMTQAEAWITTGIDPLRGVAQPAVMASRPVKSKSASGGGLSVTYGDPDPSLYALARADALLPVAWGVLDMAGLISTGVQTTAYGRDVSLVGTEYRLTTGELLP